MILAFFIQNLKYFIKSGIIYHSFLYNLIILFSLLFILKISHVFNILWIIIFLSTFLSLDLLFKQEVIDGKLDCLYLSNFSIFFYSLLKYIIYWTVCHFPFLLLISIAFSFSFIEFSCICLGSFSCTLLGGLNYLFAFGLLEKVMILSIMVFPLFIPIMVFGINLEVAILLKISLFFFFTIPLITSWLISKTIL